MTVFFPQANNYKISDSEFRAAWAELMNRYASTEESCDIPRLNSKDQLSKFNDRELSLEYLCRRLVPDGYRNTMQATQRFMVANRHIVEPTSAPVINRVTGRKVQGVKLRGELPGSSEIPFNVGALFEADVDELEEVDVSSCSIPLSSGTIVWGSYIEDFVEQINVDEYQPMFRLNSIGEKVKGWDARLRAYFWPNPGIGVAQTEKLLQPILDCCKALAETVQQGRPWTNIEQNSSVTVANEIFKWGGVPQDPFKVIPNNIRNVFEAALTGKVPSGTPMNSGWTKVAAFATAHLVDGQVIWDSRVSASIVRRLDSIFRKNELKSIPPAYEGIGLIAGQGGTRKNPPKLNFHWRNGYGRWDAQLIGSAFVHEVRRYLNDSQRKISGPAVKKRDWTVRCVEMVLFGDGY